MVTGASTADLAVLLVDARKGLLDQTRRHAAIVSLLGIRQVVLAVNKMDLVGFDRGVFAAIVRRFRRAAATGLAIAVTADSDLRARRRQRHHRHDAMPWYTRRYAAGRRWRRPTPPSHATGQPFRMPVQFVNRPDHTFRGYAGTDHQRRGAPGRPAGQRRRAYASAFARIVTMDGDLAEAAAGQPVTLVLDREIDVSRGDVLAAAPPPMADQIERLGRVDGRNAVVPRPRLSADARRPTVIATITDITTGSIWIRWRKSVSANCDLNEIGRVSISLSHPVAVRDVRDSRELGGFILVDRLTREHGRRRHGDRAARRTADIVWHHLDVDKAARAR